MLREAIDDFRRLPEDAPERAVALGRLLRFRAEVAKRGPVTPEEAGGSGVRDDHPGARRAVHRAARTQGIAQGAIALYEARFGPMPPLLRSAVEAMRDLPTLRTGLVLVGTGTREEAHDAITAAPAGHSS
ncbi:hypothetical protein WMF28_13110 [Sorangium sp. So ce590]|uniref:hypothetical protein n=1 Tax=Sorangium sp. So ce590 TaxID=3133317 RepID=UPI003F5FA9AE